jgi:intracellular sulfur oxidation DsrE/DsrF family protein
MLAAGCAVTAESGPQAGSSPDKVVYRFSDGLEQASDGLRNIGHHLELNPAAKIVVAPAAARGLRRPQALTLARHMSS